MSRRRTTRWRSGHAEPGEAHRGGGARGGGGDGGRVVDGRAALGRLAALLARTSGGGAVFAQPIPDPAGTTFNFTADISAALELRLARTLGASVGFRLHHLSNAGMGRANPGMNTRMLELGVARLPR